MNTQPARLPAFHLDELPFGPPPTPGPATSREAYDEAVAALLEARRVVVKVGGGARGCGETLDEFLRLTDGVAVLSPKLTGALPHDHPRNLRVGGSKGTLCGNFAMETADLLVALGTRAVCQSDSSRTGYPAVREVVNVNSDPAAALHYSRTTALVGDVTATLEVLNSLLRLQGAKDETPESDWFRECTEKRAEWEAFKAERYARPVLHDQVWGREVLTQPAAIKVATDWAREAGAVALFDAGDVQANGFQIVEDEREGQTFSETGASYMGFAASGLLATALSDRPFYGLAFTGDGSFMMNPQVLIDGVEHGVTGCILLLDNRRMAAISGLQAAQYGRDHATNDSVAVDYVKMASAFEGVLAIHGGHSTDELQDALQMAHAHDGLSLIHVPVYFGPDPLGGLGAFGRWNVGSWVDEVQALRHRIGL